jgi:hypothetical protein
MPRKYRIDMSTIVLISEDGRQVAHTVPKGAIITTNSESLNGNRLVDVIWGDKKAMMFLQDLRSRGNRITGLA